MATTDVIQEIFAGRQVKSSGGILVKATGKMPTDSGQASISNVQTLNDHIAPRPGGPNDPDNTTSEFQENRIEDRYTNRFDDPTFYSA